MDVYQAIVTKRDTRSYRPDPIEPDVLSRAFRAARMAGSAKNSQVTRLVVVTEPETKEKLAACGDFTAWIGSSPVVVVLVAPTDTMRTFDLGRMAQNLMLAAHGDGVASCPVTFHHQDRMRDTIGIPAEYEGPMGVTLGYPAEAPEGVARPSAPRIPLDDLVHYERWRS
jgi:nitroreductase